MLKHLRDIAVYVHPVIMLFKYASERLDRESVEPMYFNKYLYFGVNGKYVFL